MCNNTGVKPIVAFVLEKERAIAYSMGDSVEVLVTVWAVRFHPLTWRHTVIDETLRRKVGYCLCVNRFLYLPGRLFRRVCVNC
jgi:hypothetical protein